MQYGVQANRMTLMKLRKRLAMAQRGHSLMKHKLDELMHAFRQEIDQLIELRREVEQRLETVYHRFVLGSGMLRSASVEALLSAPLIRSRVAIERQPLLNLKVPRIRTETEMESPPYGFMDSNADLDTSVQQLKDLLPELLRLAELQKRIELIIREITVTRRRVNALEYVLIPRIEEQVRFIQMKLDENERADVSRLMRIKAIIRGEEDRSR